MFENFFVNGRFKDEILLAFCGLLSLCAGFINGFIGTGGGVIILLTLKKLHKDDEKAAYASVAAVVLPMAVISAAVYCISKPDIISDALPYLPFALIGGALGAYLLSRVKVRAVSLLFSFLAVFSGAAALLR